MDDARNDIDNWAKARVVEIEDNQIRLLPRFQRAQIALPAQRTGTVQRRRVKGRPRRRFNATLAFASASAAMCKAPILCTTL